MQAAENKLFDNLNTTLAAPRQPGSRDLPPSCRLLISNSIICKGPLNYFPIGGGTYPNRKLLKQFVASLPLLNEREQQASIDSQR